MFPLIFSDVMIFLLEKIVNVALEKTFNISFDRLMLELKLVMTDIQKIRNHTLDFTSSFVVQSLENFHHALNIYKVHCTD